MSVNPGANDDTLGLVVAGAERPLVSNFTTGSSAVFREREQFSLPCSQNLLNKSRCYVSVMRFVAYLMLPDVKVKLDAYQKVYLSTSS